MTSPDARTGRPLEVTLSNARADRVKQVRALSGRSARQRHGQFLVEGPQGVREAVRFAASDVRDVYLTEAAARRHPEIVAAAQAAGLWLHLGSDEVLEAMSANSQGALAVVNARTFGAPPLAGPDHRPRLIAILANVRDPGNAGTVIRAADAAGADQVLLAGDSVDPYNPKTVRSTAGSLFHLPVRAGLSLSEAIGQARAAGCTVLAADGAGPHDLDDLLDAAGTGPTPDLSRPTAWVFGNEAWGLSPADRSLCDAAVRVPLRGPAESLNLATAAAVCLYASSRAQRRVP
ncbi:MAG: RNA methyltransferase [Promicromonosporaceae bacterium]|nr:RNA methyltransferase [Promicromonosporaceae bacterium]